MNLDDFSYTENDRRYINPQVSLAEQNAFINNLRNNQQDWTDETISVTENLGTKIPSQLGGLTGGSGYFASRYQTPQTNSMVSDLRAAAQSQALSQLMNNEIAKAQKRYSDAYRAAKKRESDANSNGGNGNDLADYLKELKTNLNPDDSSDPYKTVPSTNEGFIEADKETQLKQLRKQLKQVQEQGAGVEFWDFLNPVTTIGKNVIWANHINDIKERIRKLEEGE